MATRIENPGGAVVEVTDERADELLEQDGFEEVEPQPESSPAPPAPTPEQEEGTEDEPDQELEEGPESGQSGEEGLEELTDEELEALPERERIEYALETDDYNTMRGVLAGLIDESTQGMGKAEVREALESMQG